MHQDVVQRLLDLNQEFYQTFAAPFSETRARVQPGVKVAIEDLGPGANVIDLGCGNGSLANELAHNGHDGLYLGLDSSNYLVNDAIAGSKHPNSTFEVVDLVNFTWSNAISDRFDRVFAFALIHHIPSVELRNQFLAEIHRIILPDGILVFSVWNFLASAKLRSRIVPWVELGLDESQLEPGDYLLDWKRGGYGLRYVHAFEGDELVRLAVDTGYNVIDQYVSDGEGGNLGLYHVWGPQK